MAHRQSLAPNRNGSSKQSQQSQPQPPQTSLIGYPILKTVEIVDCLQELHVPIQEEDINRPNAQSIQTAWAILLESFNGVTIEGFERPKGALLGMMQYPVSWVRYVPVRWEGRRLARRNRERRIKGQSSLGRREKGRKSDASRRRPKGGWRSHGLPWSWHE
jgi:hypothetical protein